MRGLCLGVLLVFGLGWGLTLAATAALPVLIGRGPAGMALLAGPAGRAALDWAGTQTLMGTGLAAAGWLCASAGARGWSVAALVAIPPLLALAVIQFDPRLVTALQTTLGPGFDALRGGQAGVRLALFTGLSLIGAAYLIGGRIGPPAVGLTVLAALAAMVALTTSGAQSGPQSGPGLALLGLPALVLLAVAGLRLADHDQPAAPYVVTGAVCVLVGSGMLLAEGSPRQDLRPAFLLFPVLAVLASRAGTRRPTAAIWLHAGLIGLGIGYLAPGLAQFGDVRPASTLAEIGTTLRRAETLRTGVGGLLALLGLIGVLALRRRS